MSKLAAIVAANVANAPKSIVPVAVVVGGTAGIGAAVAETLARHTHGRAHILLVGRNQSAAEEIISRLPKSVDGGKYEFVQCDVSSMRNVGSVTRALAGRLDRVNYLVMSPGILSMAGRRPTEDGVDLKVALHYYGRFKFARDLVGLLEKAAEQGEPARVMTILDSKSGGPIFADDMALEQNYSVSNAASTACTYNSAAMVALAQRHPTVSFTHAYPGVVNTSVSGKLPLPLRALTNSLYHVFGVSAHDCGEYMTYSLFDPALANGGAFFRDNVGKEVPRNKHLTPETVEKVWQHSIAITDGK